MLKPKKILALIPARQGSKRIPNKNTLELCGKPLLAWTILSAINSDLITDVIVSTDSDTIKSISEKFGAKVPFLRPKYLASDTASTDAVILHAIEQLGLEDSDIIIILQPTSPLRNSKDIDAALNLLIKEDLMGVVSVCECQHSPLWSNTLREDHLMDDFIDQDILSKRSQELPIYYRLNGAIYAYRVSYFAKHKKRVYSNKVKAYIMPFERSIDIDYPIDFSLAEFLIGKVE